MALTEDKIRRLDTAFESGALTLPDTTAQPAVPQGPAPQPILPKPSLANLLSFVAAPGATLASRIGQRLGIGPTAAPAIGAVAGGLTGVPILGPALGAVTGRSVQEIGERFKGETPQSILAGLKGVTPELVEEQLRRPTLPQEEREFAEDIRKTGVFTGTIDLVAMGIFNKLANLIRRFGGATAEGISGSALDLTKSMARKEIKAGKNLAAQVVERRVTGSADDIIKQGKTAREVAGTQIDDFFKTVPDEQINLREIVDRAIREDIRVAESGGDPTTAKALEEVGDRIVKKHGENISAKQALQIKKDLDKLVQKTFGKKAEVGSIASTQNLSRRDVSDAIRGKLKTTYPLVARALDDQSFWFRLEEAMINKLAGQRAGGIVPTGDFRLISNLIKPLRSPQVLTPAAKGVDTATSALSQILPPAAKVPTQVALQQLIGREQ